MAETPETAIAAPAAEQIRIRDGVASDVPAVIALDETVTGLAKPDYWQGLFDREGPPRRRRRHFLVAVETGEKDGRLLGFIIGEARAWEFGSPPCGWVFAISVDPEARLAGVGSRLLAAISDRFREEGVDKMRTMLSRNNHLLMSFFRSHGMMAGPHIQLEKDLD